MLTAEASALAWSPPAGEYDDVLESIAGLEFVDARLGYCAAEVDHQRGWGRGSGERDFDAGVGLRAKQQCEDARDGGDGRNYQEGVGPPLGRGAIWVSVLILQQVPNRRSPSARPFVHRGKIAES